MNRVLTLEPGFDFSGPYRFFGSLYTRIPGIDLSQSKIYFDQALETNPEYLVPIVQAKEDVVVLVAGGEGRHSTWMAGWGVTRMKSEQIALLGEK